MARIALDAMGGDFAPRATVAGALLAPAATIVKADGTDVEKKASGKQRLFQFTYAGAIKDLAPGKTARVWLPVPVTVSFATAPISPASSSPIGSCSLPWRRRSWPIRSSASRFAFQT